MNRQPLENICELFILVAYGGCRTRSWTAQGPSRRRPGPR
jgi:hypothetical protein